MKFQSDGQRAKAQDDQSGLDRTAGFWKLGAIMSSETQLGP